METKSEDEYILPDQETQTNQFYILQDDGTIISMNKEVQYVTQVQDIKNVISGNGTEECVFDTSQQYYVNVDNVAPELIPINDEFTIQLDENNVYASSFLIQPNRTCQQTEPKPVDLVNVEEQQVQPCNTTFNNIHQEKDLTEITLSDEQYQVLEQKGWILLESNDKIFVLNPLGLHDITNDDKLIQKLKSELVQPDLETEFRIGPEQIEESMIEEDNKVEGIVASDGLNEEEENDKKFTINQTHETLVVEMRDQEEPTEIIAEQVEIPIDYIKPNIKNENVIEQNTAEQNCESIKIKTKYKFTDIPDKIFLGKTVNGKSLYAKVTMKNKDDHHKIIKPKKRISALIKKDTVSLLPEKPIDNMKPNNCTGLDTARFINLVQDSFRASFTINPQTVESANHYISELMQLPNMKESIVGNNMVLTKIIASKTEEGMVIGQPTMVTGTVEIQNGKGWFVHVPQMLQKILEESDKKLKLEADPLSEAKIAKDVIDLLHIHVYEMRLPHKVPQIAINLSKRKLPLDVLNDAKKRHPNPIYACGACGLVFKSEPLLQAHQNNQCLEAEDELTIDTDEISDGNIDHLETLYYMSVIGQKKWYHCMICKATFSKLYNCQKHIATHNRNSLEKKGNVYKCKMCPGTFSYSSSLSKHIVKMHLQIQSK